MALNQIIIITIIGLILFPNWSFLQAQEIKASETFKELKGIGERFVKKILEDSPQILKEAWQKEVLPIWKTIWDWIKNIWNSYLGPKFDPFWQKIKTIFKIEIEKRKPIIEEEFKKEKEEMKEEFPQVQKSLWERFKELIK